MLRPVTKLVERLRESDVTGRVFATVLASSTHNTILPIYRWLRRAWGSFDPSPAHVWIVSAAYFSLCVWLFVLLTRNGKQYRAMTLDAICGGSLITVAVALWQPSVRTALSQTGFGWAAWVVFLSASWLVLARSLQPHKITHTGANTANHGPQQPPAQQSQGV